MKTLFGRLESFGLWVSRSRRIAARMSWIAWMKRPGRHVQGHDTDAAVKAAALILLLLFLALLHR
jgi:hypothetical protein